MAGRLTPSGQQSAAAAVPKMPPRGPGFQRVPTPNSTPVGYPRSPYIKGRA